MALPITEGRNQKEGWIWHWSLGKEDLKHIKLGKKEKKRQQNIAQMREQVRNSLKTHIKINKLPEKEFRVKIVKTIQNFKNGMEKMQKWINTFNKDLEETKNKQTEINNTITEIKNTLEGINIGWIKENEWKELRIVSETPGVY